MALTLRTIKGSRLTHEELDGNFRHLTGSHEVSGSITAVAFSGSFSGSFVGDGSGLTGISAGAADLTGTDVISGSAQIAELGAGIISGSSQLPAGTVSGSAQIDGTQITNNVINLGNSVITLGAASAVPRFLNAVNLADTKSSGSFSGSFEGDGSGLTGVTATPDLTNTDIISGSNLSYDLTTTSWNVSDELNTTGGLYASSKFSIYGTSTTVNGANALWDSATVRYIASTLKFVESPTNNVSKVEIDGTAGAVTASYFTGSFVGDGSGLTGVAAGNVELLPGTTLPSVANSTTGSMILMDDGIPLNGTSPALYIYTGAGATGWQQIQLL